MNALQFVLLVVGLVAFEIPLVQADDFPEPVNTQASGEHPPSPQEMLELFELPPGFKVTLFAGEPDVQQPIAFEFDDYGRIWVAENYTYNRQGNQDSAHRDRVIILEDKDGDGQHDIRKVFWDNGNMLTGLTWGFGGLWILNDGTLSFIPDEDGDDVPDSEPVVMLNGWTKTAGHNFVNGLLWGPDGWLYGRHGITDSSLPGTPDTPQDQRQPMNCGIWRFHPTKHVFEIVCHGTTNPWGLDYNAVGDMFMSNNVIGHLWHVIPGAHYQRMFGQDFNPYLYELMEPCSDHYHWDATGNWHESRDGKADDLGGGHSHCGLLIYQGDNFPEEYRGKAFMCNTHGRCVNVDRLERKGSTYVAKHEPNFLKVNTPWFRGVELRCGPRGCVYLSDWSDNGECHDRDGVHRTSGRIYRISYGDVELDEEITDSDLTSDPNDLLPRWFQIDNDSVFERRRNRRRFLEMISACRLHKPDLDTAGDDFWLKLGLTDHNLPSSDFQTFWSKQEVSEQSALETLRVLIWSDALTPDVARLALWSRHETVQAAAVHAILSNDKLLMELEKDVLGALRTNDSPVVALAFASACQRPTASLFREGALVAPQWKFSTIGGICMDLVFNTRTAKLLKSDKTLRLMTWYSAVGSEFTAWMCDLAEASELSTFAYRYRFERCDLDDSESTGRMLSSMAAQDKSASQRQRKQIGGILKAIRGRRMAEPDDWDETRRELTKFNDPRIDELAEELGAKFGNAESLESLHQLIRDRKGDHAVRSRAIATVAAVGNSKSVKVLLSLLNDRAVYVDVAKALASYDDPRVPKELLKRWKDLRHGGKEAAIDTLCSRKSYGLAFAKAIADGRVDVDNLTAVHVRQLLAFDEPEITTIVETHWGIINESSEAKAAAAANLRKALTPDVLAAANLESGAALFKKTCAACHKLYGDGGSIGPDLTGANRGNLDYLLENILDPSSVVPKQFTVSVMELKSGRVVSGVIVAETPNTLTVQTDKDQVVIALADIEERVRTTKSLMPDGLLSTLSDDQVRDLLAFVMKRR